jgi:hypothetical protein
MKKLELANGVIVFRFCGVEYEGTLILILRRGLQTVSLDTDRPFTSTQHNTLYADGFCSTATV